MPHTIVWTVGERLRDHGVTAFYRRWSRPTSKAAAHPAIYRLTQLRGLDPDGPRTITKVTETL